MLALALLLDHGLKSMPPFVEKSGQRNARHRILMLKQGMQANNGNIGLVKYPAKLSSPLFVSDQCLHCHSTAGSRQAMTHIPRNPFDHFDDWHRQAMLHKDVKDANAVNLATSTANGMPSNRMILLKGHGPGGFIFYTNLNSRKGKELEENRRAAMCFYWAPLAKQVRIEGDVTPVSDKEADQYFVSRPLRSRIGAWASRQSQPLENRAALLKDITRETARFAFAEIERPPFWSGFRLIPQRMEFWKSGEYRLHDRLAYTLDENGLWQKQLLYP